MEAAVAHAGDRVIGLDGVVAQQQNYQKSGFALAYANVRYGGASPRPDAPAAATTALTEVPLAAVEASDRTVFPAPRAAFLRAWIGAPGHIGRALLRDGRACRLGRHPSVPRRATRSARWSPTIAPPLKRCWRRCWRAGAAARSSSTSPASTATRWRWRRDLGLAPVFETARMYTGAIPPLRLERVFGVTTFELG